MKALAASLIFALVVFLYEGKSEIDIVATILFFICYIAVTTTIRYTQKRHQK